METSTVAGVISLLCILGLCDPHGVVAKPSTTPDDSASRNEDKEFLEHFSRVYEEGRCNPQPQPRMVYVHEFSERYEVASDMYYLPPGSLLYRCEPSNGCCFGSESLQCGPVASHQVQLVFRVMNPKVKNARVQPKYQHFTVSNHTKCGCVDVSHDEIKPSYLL